MPPFSSADAGSFTRELVVAFARCASASGPWSSAKTCDNYAKYVRHFVRFAASCRPPVTAVGQLTRRSGMPGRCLNPDGANCAWCCWRSPRCLRTRAQGCRRSALGPPRERRRRRTRCRSSPTSVPRQAGPSGPRCDASRSTRICWRGGGPEKHHESSLTGGGAGCSTTSPAPASCPAARCPRPAPGISRSPCSGCWGPVVGSTRWPGSARPTRRWARQRFC